MSELYTLVTPGAPPVSLETMKESLRVDSDRDDDYIDLAIRASTEIVERVLHGRQIRDNAYSLKIDAFAARICLTKDPVAAVTSITRDVSGTPTAVSSDDYYLKRSQQFSEILLTEDASWPTDQDDLEHSIEILFTTAAHDIVNVAIAAIQRHVTFMFSERGDCDPTSARNSFEASGAGGLLGPARIQLV